MTWSRIVMYSDAMNCLPMTRLFFLWNKLSKMNNVLLIWKILLGPFLYFTSFSEVLYASIWPLLFWFFDWSFLSISTRRYLVLFAWALVISKYQINKLGFWIPAIPKSLFCTSSFLAVPGNLQSNLLINVNVLYNANNRLPRALYRTITVESYFLEVK